MSRRTAAAALAAVVLSSSADEAPAQAAGAPAPTAPVRVAPPPQPERNVHDVQARLYREQAAEAARKQKALEAEALKTATPERLARAERVAALLNQGKCADAAKLALREGDQDLANKVGQICRKKADR